MYLLIMFFEDLHKHVIVLIDIDVWLRFIVVAFIIDQRCQQNSLPSREMHY
jgi:hypothetical protein